MEHLVRPNDRTRIADVPVFESALHLCDGLGFESFLNRTEHSSTDASFHQGWLFWLIVRGLSGLSASKRL